MRCVALTPAGESVARFFAWTLALSWPFWLLDLTGVRLLPGLPVSALVALAPMLAALVVTQRSPGQSWSDAVHELMAPSRAGWLGVLAVGVPAVCGLLTYVVVRAMDPLLPAPRWSASLVLLFAVFYVGALAEELGWTGLANRALAGRWSPWAAGLLIGSVWAVWHWVPLIAVGRHWGWIAAWSVYTVFCRILMCQLFALGLRSVAWLAAFHAVTNIGWQAFPVNGSQWNPVVAALVTGFMAAGVRGLDRFSRTPARR